MAELQVSVQTLTGVGVGGYHFPYRHKKEKKEVHNRLYLLGAVMGKTVGHYSGLLRWQTKTPACCMLG